MNRTVEKIVINTEGMDVISVLNGVNNVTQLNLEPQENEVQEIFMEYNLETGVIYHYDEKILRALKENKEQLIDYLETCRKANFPAKKVDVPVTIPEMEYDLRNLKNAFQNIEDEDLRKKKQIDLYKKAKEVQNMLRGKVILKMRILDRAYFSVQEMLQNRNSKSTRLLLNPGTAEERMNFRDRLYNPEFTKKTDEVSQEYAEQTVENQEVKESEEIVK